MGGDNFHRVSGGWNLAVGFNPHGEQAKCASSRGDDYVFSCVANATHYFVPKAVG